MSNEFKEWKETEPLHENDDAIKVSEQQLTDELKKLLGIEEQNAAEGTKDVFKEFPSFKLMDENTLEQLQRKSSDTAAPSDCKIEVGDYTSGGYVNDTGIFCPGQIELDKLTDRALENISGDIVNDIPLWHNQLEDNSCAVACQDFILRGSGKDTVSEQQLIDEGRDLGIYHDDGTYCNDIGLLAEYHGMERKMLYNADLEQIENIHESGGKVIAVISSLKMAYPNVFGFWRSDHAVEVIGIDRNDPDDVRVILNDPGREDGRGLSVPEKVFVKAWKTSQKSLVALYPKEEK